MKQEDIEKHIEAIWDSVEVSADKMQRIYGPSWSAKIDLAKILITVSSALLAALLAFSKDVFDGVSGCIVYLPISSEASPQTHET
jgi:hypothetical protein